MSEDVQTCLNLFRFNMIRIVNVNNNLRHVSTCPKPSYDKILKNLRKWHTKVDDEVIPWIAASKSSDQKRWRRVSISHPFRRETNK